MAEGNLFNEYFDGTDGASLSTSNTIYDLIGGTAPVFDDDSPAPLHGGAAALPATGLSYVRYDDTPGDNNRYRRFYIYLAAAPSAAMVLLQYRSDSATLAEVRINTNRTLTLRAPTTARATSAAALPTGEWVRVEVLYDPGTTFQVRAYWGANLEDSGATPDLTATYNSTSQLPNTQTQTLLGKVSSATITGGAWLAADAGDTSSWIGPVPTASSEVPGGVLVGGVKKAVVSDSVIVGGVKKAVVSRGVIVNGVKQPIP